MIGQVGGAGDVIGRAHGGGHGGTGGRIVEAADNDRRLGLRLGQHLDCYVGHSAERAPGAGKQLAQVVAGDVLHHAPARLDCLSASGDGGETEEMVARSAGFDAAWAGEIGRDYTADRALASFSTEQRTVVDGLEAELLLVFIEQFFDLGERRTGARGEHEFRRLVKRDAGEVGKVEGEIGLARAADRAFAALPHELQRLLFAERPAHGLFDLLGVARFDRVGHRALIMAGLISVIPVQEAGPTNTIAITRTSPVLTE